MLNPAASGTPYRPIRPHALRSAGDIWVVQRNPYLQGRPDPQPRPPQSRWSRRWSIAWPRSTNAASPTRMRCAISWWVSWWKRPTAPCMNSTPLCRGRAAARRAQKTLRRYTAIRDNIKFDGLSRGPCDRCDRLARRIPPVCRADARIPKPRWPAWSRGCIELGLTIIPRGGGTGYAGGAIP